MGLFTERDEETPNEIIIGKLNRIEAKLDEVIAAMHAYDDDFDDEEVILHNIPSDVLKEAADTYNEYVANKRMDIIGQNGNEGSHYVTNEEADEDAFNDYGMRVMGDRDNNNNKGIQPKQKQYYKNKYSKRNSNKK